MAASLDDLPSELIFRAIRHLGAKRDIANVRLVSRRLESIAVEILFENITLYPHWYKDRRDELRKMMMGPPGYDAKVFKNIIDHPRLKRYVKTVNLYTVEPHCNHHPYETGIWPDPPWVEYDESYDQCWDNLGNLPNLNSVSLHFDMHVSPPYIADKNTLQCDGERHDVLAKLLRILDGRIVHLAIRNYGNGQQELMENPEDSQEFMEDNEDSQLWQPSLKSLESLRLNVVHKEECHQRDSNLRGGHPQPFWFKLPSFTLHHTQNNLKRLFLYSSLQVGYFPKVDLRGVHFPHLSTLALGYFTFWRDWQFDWITSHGNTLKHLYLDRCSILYQVGCSHKGFLDGEGFPTSSKTQYFSDAPVWDESPFGSDAVQYADGGTYFSSPYNTRWHTIFLSFAEKLEHLRVFKFGSSSQWKFGLSAHCCIGQCGKSYPIMPWEAEADIENAIHNYAYVVYADWGECFEPNWTAAWDADKLGGPESYTSYMSQLYDQPDCKAEDEIALKKLVEKAEQRLGS